MPNRSIAACFGIAVCAALVVAAEQADDPLASQKQRLAKMQVLVGSWRGVAQPQRGSSKGSWIEQAEWAWKFDQDQVALEADIADGKLFSSAHLAAGEEPGAFVLRAKPTRGGDEVEYQGQLDDEGKLTLVATAPVDGLPARISIRTVAGGDRLLVLYEKQTPGAQYARLAEIGYTRKGSGFGKGSSGPECVVTGGFGSIEVTHAGKTYYVCCTGCRDYFNDNPEEVLAEYAARKAAEKAEKKQ